MGWLAGWLSLLLSQPPRHRVRFDLAGFLTRYHLTPVGATFLVGQHTKGGATPLSVPTTG